MDLERLVNDLESDSLSAPARRIPKDISTLKTGCFGFFLYLPYSSAWQVKLVAGHELAANRPQAPSKKAGKKGQAAPAKKTGGGGRNNKVAKVCTS